MCKQGASIKFCSCDSDTLDLPFPYWVLYREVGKERFTIVGSFLPPAIPSVLERITINAVSDALNSNESFDFAYDPKVNDQFVLYVSEEQIFHFSCDHDRESADEIYWQYNLGSFFWDDDFKRIHSGGLVDS